MDIQAVCRVCLADSIKMHEVTNLQLQEVYEKLTDINAKMGIDERPITLCYICYSQLKRCCQFLKAARRSESILTQLYHRTIELTSVVDRPPIYSYSITPIEHVSVYEPITEGIEKLVQDFKKEIFEVADETKLPELADVVKSDPDIDLHSDADPSIPSQSSDSEDDLPLTNFKKDKARQKRIYKKRSKLDAREVLVPKEQQIQDVLSRATSLNYLNSPHRCALCYRGFLNHDAFRNHQAKHDKRSGAHECDVCRLRYRTARLLRAHTHSAHSRRYQCNKCTHTSHTTHQAYDHEQWHNGHTYECQLCGHKFLKRTSYLTHTRKAHPSDHICNVCGERFVGRHGLLMHKSKTHNRVKEEEEKEDTSPREDRFCSSCDIQFLTLDAWKRHIITSIKHTLQTQQSGTCLICRAYVPHGAAEHMRSHVRRSRPHTDTQARTHTDTQARTHAGEAELHCEQCPQTFLNKAKLTAHVRRVHLGLKYNKNIVCEVCGKKCTSNATLKYHQRTHTGERPHPCATCGKRFSDTNQLRIHSRTHTGEKPYSCQHCSKRFAQKPALNRHYRVHTGAKPYACELCSKSFSQSNSLKVHVRAVHLKMQSYRRGRGASGNNLPGGTQAESNK